MPFVTIFMPLCLTLAAEQAAMPILAGSGLESCKAILARVAQAGERRGYRVTRGALGLAGRRGPAEMKAWCAAGSVELAFSEADDSTVSVRFGQHSGDGYELEILGQFPAVGAVSRAAILEDAGADRLTGSLSFTADAGVGPVFAGLDFEDGVVAVHEDVLEGELQRVNSKFEPALTVSTIWKDAHVLAYAAAGAWEVVMREHELDAILGLAIPLPESKKVDADSKDSVQKCGAAFVLCVAAAWLPPAGAWACGVALTNCLAALPCLPSDCAGDGV